MGIKTILLSWRIFTFLHFPHLLAATVKLFFYRESMSASSSSSLAKKLAQMNMTTHSKSIEVVQQFAYSIDNFHRLMDSYTENNYWRERPAFKAPLPGRQKTLSLRIDCIPRHRDADDDEVVSINVMFSYSSPVYDAVE
jgi:hypothetical protein